MANDHKQISNVLGRYVELIDSGRYDELSECFTSDAVGEYAGATLEPGLHAIITFVSGLSNFVSCQHLLFPVAVSTDGDIAAALTYGTAVLLQEAEGGHEAIVRGLSYEHELFRTTDGWRITRLTQQARWSLRTPATVHPGSVFS